MIKKEKIKDLHYTVNGFLTAAEVQTAADDVLQKYGKDMKMPGFRAGHIPLSVLRQKYNASAMGEAIDALMNKDLEQYATDKKIRLAGSPKAEVVMRVDSQCRRTVADGLARRGAHVFDAAGRSHARRVGQTHAPCTACRRRGCHAAQDRRIGTGGVEQADVALQPLFVHILRRGADLLLALFQGGFIAAGERIAGVDEVGLELSLCVDHRFQPGKIGRVEVEHFHHDLAPGKRAQLRVQLHGHLVDAVAVPGVVQLHLLETRRVKTAHQLDALLRREGHTGRLLALAQRHVAELQRTCRCERFVVVADASFHRIASFSIKRKIFLRECFLSAYNERGREEKTC